jgi:hypothetical protein
LSLLSDTSRGYIEGSGEAPKFDRTRTLSRLMVGFVFGGPEVVLIRNFSRE